MFVIYAHNPADLSFFLSLVTYCMHITKNPDKKKIIYIYLHKKRDRPHIYIYTYVSIYIFYIYVHIYILYTYPLRDRIKRARNTTRGKKRDRVTWSPGVIIRRHCSMRQLGREDGKCQTDRAIYRRLGVICAVTLLVTRD